MKRSAFLLLCSLTMASAGEWTQWRGPGRMDHSPDKAILSSWPEGGPKQLWLSRDGGLGYAEEYPVSRLYVDARVLSIFEGADETLCLKVIARRLVEDSRA